MPQEYDTTPAFDKKEYRKELYDYCTKHHICHNCYTKDAFTENGRALCAECTQKANEYKRLHTNKQHRNELRKELRKKRIENHECAECGTKLADDYSYKTCQKCREKKRRAYLKQHPNAFTRGKIGLCWLCNKKPMYEDKKTCKECYEKLSKACIEHNKNMGNKNHIWRKMQFGKNVKSN